MAELKASERSAVESIVVGVHRRNARRRQAARSGWALLATAGIALPVIASAMEDAISLTTAITRIGIAFLLTMFVVTALGSLLDNYQMQAALHSVESALVNARSAAADAAADVAMDSISADSDSQGGARDVTGA
ncbi:MAG: hypothetical protein R2707_11705 [Acidimicrobiales bacterium]